MLEALKTVSHRHLPVPSHKVIAFAGLGVTLCIIALGALSSLSTLVLLFAPFGASAVLLLGMPAGPLSQPANIELGYLACMFIVSVLAGSILLVAAGIVWHRMTGAKYHVQPA
jgi:CBS-domain-containing membrane protein